MGCSCQDKTLLHLIRDLFLFPQDEGFEDSSVRRLRLLFNELTDPVPPSLDLAEQRVFYALADLYPAAFYRYKSDGMNLLEGEMAFIGEDTRVSKSMRRIELADESKAIPCMKGAAFFLYKEKERALDRDETV
jgi:hypothetical protein